MRNFTERLLLHDAFLWALLSVLGWILSSAHATQTQNTVFVAALRYFTATYVCFMILVETLEGWRFCIACEGFILPNQRVGQLISPTRDHNQSESFEVDKI